LSALAVFIAMSGSLRAAAPDAPPPHPGPQAVEYERLTTNWACATVRLYLRERSSTNEEAWDWNHGAWRLSEVVRAIQALPWRSRCIGDSDLADLKNHVDVIQADAARAEEAYRLFWLMDLLGQSDQGSKASRPPVIAETVSKMRAAGWGNDAILTAVSDPNSREARIFRSSLITRVQQWDHQMGFPYRDPVVPYLPPPEPQQVEALRHAASAATDAAREATTAAKKSMPAPPVPAAAPSVAAPR
jgi:hypothetical protein